MLGHPTLIQHSFPVIECMASSKFHIKQIGYLAASQSFGESTEVILLANNLIKKDLQSSSHLSTVILALTSLPTLLIASPQLADDLLHDLLRMLTHSRSEVRRIATLVIGKIWASQHSVPLEFDHVEKLRHGLNDEYPSVVAATVNVMLELGRARKEALPSLLGLAPELFELLTNSTNNWMLIKVVKVVRGKGILSALCLMCKLQFALLTPIEPRLVRKLLPPLSSLISSTPAFSLLYECIQTVIIGGMLSTPSAESTSLAATCIAKLSSFLSDSDQNLRYIALKGLSRLLVTHAHLLSAHYEEILSCIDEEDLTIRLKALELVERLTDRSNCKDVVQRLLLQFAPISSAASLDKGKGRPGLRPASAAAAALRAISSNYDATSPSGLAKTDEKSESILVTSDSSLSAYRHRLLLLILRLTSRASEDGSQLYVNISNFEWYIETLVTISYLSLSSPLITLYASPLATTNDARLIRIKVEESLLDVTARATSIRNFAVMQSKKLISDEGFDEAGGAGILNAAAFIISEYGLPRDGNECCQLLVTRAINSSSTSDTLLLCAIKALAKWLNWLATDDWRIDRLTGIKSQLKNVLYSLESAGDGADHYAYLVSLVVDGLDGRRLAGKSFVELSMEMTDDHRGEAGDPEHNPFASTSNTDHSHQSRMPQESNDAPPASLVLLDSIFSAYELRPLAPGAQSAVLKPEALDLDAWVGDPLEESSLMDSETEEGQISMARTKVDEFGRPRVVSENGKANSQRNGTSQSIGKKKKVKRKIMDTQTTAETEDVDSIPIIKIKLDEEGAVSPGVVQTAPERLRIPSPPPLVLAAGGDMPARALVKNAPLPTEPSQKPLAGNQLALLAPSYSSELLEEESSEQPAIQIVRVKKKVIQTKSAAHSKKKKLASNV